MIPHAPAATTAGLVALLTMAVHGTAPAAGPITIAVVIKDHVFTPAEIHVPTGVPVVLKIRNDDATAEEFDSSDLKTEKVIAAGYEGLVRLRPLGPGRYAFMGEFHPDTARGVVISE
jgi:plastocyanin